MFFYLQNQQKVVSNQQQLIAQKAADTVKGFINEKLNILETASNLGNLSIKNKEEHELVLKKLLGLEEAFRQLVLLDEQGNELLRVSRLSVFDPGQLTKQTEDNLISHVSQGEIYTSTVLIDEKTCEPLVVVAIPVNDVFGDYKGALMAEVNLKFMWNLVGNSNIGQNGLAYVVDRQANLIAFHDSSRVLSGENLIHLKEVRKFVNKKNHRKNRVDISKGIQDTHVVTTHVPLGIPDWAVVIELPVLEAYETVTMTVVVSVLVMLFSFLLAITAGIYISNRITKPIIDLRDATRSISKGNMDTSIEVMPQNEIGELAQSFNQMVDDLRRTTVTQDYLMKEVNERRKVEEQLRKTEEKYRKLFEGAHDCIVVVDAETGIIIDCNPEATRLVERERSELIGQHQCILYPHNGKTGAFNKILEECHKKNNDKPIVTRVVTKTGKIKDVAVKASLLEISGKKVVQGIYRDITELKKSEKDLKKYVKKIEAINKELDDFTYIISHDLKEPLWSIDVLGMVLENEYKSLFDKEGKEYLEQIRLSSQKMQNLIEDLLQISRLGKKKNPFVKVEIEKIIKEAQVRLEHLISKYKAKVIIQTTLPVLSCDRIRLTEVFVNLLSNALKFNDKPEPIVEIGCAAKTAFYEFYIKDNGPGIKKQDHDKIFEIFQSIGKSEDKAGTGVGLTICKKIIQLHNGKIWVDSELGKGTTFYFTIPKKGIKINTKISSNNIKRLK
jgi:PAS domain S-box-containing protein